MIARLDEIFDLQMGKTPSRNNANYWTNGQYNWISIADLSTYQKYVETTKEKISSSAVQESGIKSVPANTVIMSFKLSLGKAAITQEPIYTNEAIMAFIPTGKYAVLPDYFYYLFTAKDWTKGTNRAVMGTTLNKATLGTVSVAVPSIEKQRHIAAVLDKVSDLIVKRKQQLDKLDEMVKARFVEMFGGIHDSILYPYVAIESFTSVVSGGTPDRGIQEYWKDGNIPWVKTTELQNSVITNTEEKITRLGMDNSSTKLIPANSILIAMYGQGKTRGMTGYLGIESTTNQACACILPSSSINQKYLWIYMILSYDKLRDMAKGGNQLNLNTGIIKKFPVLIPPLKSQNQFAAFVEQIDKLKLTMQRSLDKLEVLKKALMQRYFG